MVRRSGILVAPQALHVYSVGGVEALRPQPHLGNKIGLETQLKGKAIKAFPFNTQQKI